MTADSQRSSLSLKLDTPLYNRLIMLRLIWSTLWKRPEKSEFHLLCVCKIIGIVIVFWATCLRRDKRTSISVKVASSRSKPVLPQFEKNLRNVVPRSESRVSTIRHICRIHGMVVSYPTSIQVLPCFLEYHGFPMLFQHIAQNPWFYSLSRLRQIAVFCIVISDNYSWGSATIRIEVWRQLKLRFNDN